MKNSDNITVINIAKDIHIAAIHAKNKDILKKSVVEIATPIQKYLVSLDDGKETK